MLAYNVTLWSIITLRNLCNICGLHYTICSIYIRLICKAMCMNHKS